MQQGPATSTETQIAVLTTRGTYWKPATVTTTLHWLLKYNLPSEHYSHHHMKSWSIGFFSGSTGFAGCCGCGVGA